MGAVLRDVAPWRTGRGAPPDLTVHFGSTRFGDLDYAREELEAELRTFLCAGLGLRSITSNAASHIDSRLKAIDHEPGALIAAAGKARRRGSATAGL